MSGTQHRGRSALKLTPNKIPAFTLEDMKAYLQSTPSCSGGATLSGQSPTIDTLEFVGCRELTDRLHLFIGLPDDALVCYAVLHGPFRLTLMSSPPGAVQGIPVSETIEEIYDARIGDLLVWSVGPSKPS